MDEKFFDELREKIQPHFEAGESHEFEHTERVLKNAVRLAEIEGGDLEIVRAAALLHDIARVKEGSGEVECHADEGAKMAEELLLENGFPKEKISRVCEAIRVHRLSKGIVPESKEAQILQDADRLDSLGAILVARSFSSGPKYNRPFYDSSGGRSVVSFIRKRNSKIKPSNFNTETAKNEATIKYDFTEEFVDRFIKECEGGL